MSWLIAAVVHIQRSLLLLSLLLSCLFPFHRVVADVALAEVLHARAVVHDDLFVILKMANPGLFSNSILTVAFSRIRSVKRW